MHPSDFSIVVTEDTELLQTLNMKTNTTIWVFYVNNWLFLHLQLLDCAVVALVLSTIFLRETSAAQAGFMLAFASTISDHLSLAIECMRNIETKGVCLERISEYELLEGERDSFSLIAEGPQSSQQSNNHKNWPKSGTIQVQNLCARYRPNYPDILHNVSFEVGNGQRVGIVGVTGGGKSTLAKAFFEFVDISGGSIQIDGKGESLLLAARCPGED